MPEVKHTPGWADLSPAEIVRRTRCEADAYGDEFIRAAIWRDCCDAILSKLTVRDADVAARACYEVTAAAVRSAMPPGWVSQTWDDLEEVERELHRNYARAARAT